MRRDKEKKGLDRYKKFYDDLMTSLKFNHISVPQSIVENADGELYQGSIGGKHEYSSYCMTSDSRFLFRGSKNRCVKLLSLSTQRLLERVEGFPDSVIDTFVTLDRNVFVAVTLDNTITVWAVSNLRKLATLPSPRSHIRLLAGTSRPANLIGAGDDGCVVFWSLGTYKKIKEMSLSPAGILCLDCSPDSQYAAVGCDDKTVRLIDLEQLRMVRTVIDLNDSPTCLCFSYHSQFILVGTANKQVRMFSGNHYGNLVFTFKHYGCVDDVAISQDSRLVAACSNKLLLIYSFEETPPEKIETREVFLDDKICNVFFTTDSQQVICGCANDKVITLEADTGEKIYEIKGESHNTPITACLASPDSRVVVSGTASGEVKEWSLDTYMFTASLEDSTPQMNDVSTLCISPDGRYIACAPYKEYKTIKIWSLQSKQVVKEIEIKEGVDDICFSYDSEYLICSSSETDFWLWDLERLEKLQISKKVNSKILCMAPSRRSPDKKYLVGSTQDKNIIVWEYPHFDIVATMQEEDIPSLYHLVIISFNSKYLATASDKNHINLWSLRSYTMLKRLEGHTDRILSISFSPDANYILSCSRNDRVLIWSTFFADTKLFVLEGETRTINSVCITPDSRYILGGSDDSSINVWRLDSNLPKSFIKTRETVDFYAISPDSQVLAIVMEGTVELWSLHRMAKLQQIEDLFIENITTVTFTPNSHYMLVGSVQDSNVVILSMKTYNIVGNLQGIAHGPQEVFSIACSPDNKSAVTADSYQNLYKWSLNDYSSIGTIQIKNDQFTAVKNTVCITPDMKSIVAAYGRGFIGVWDYETLADKKFLKMHDNPITHLAITSFSNYIISASQNDKTIRIVSTHTFKEVDTIEHTHNHPVVSLSLSGDTKYMVGILEDRTCRIWSLQSFQQIEILSDHEAGEAVALSPNSKYLILQSDKKKKTVVYPFLSDEFQTYPFILNLIKAYFEAPSKEKRNEILLSLIVIITKHRKYYQVVLNPIFSIITLLLNEELTTEVILAQYLTPYKLFSNYEPLTVVIMNNRIESAKTYLRILENYRKDHGFYPYFDQGFIRLLLTQFPDMINSLDMKRFIIENLFYYVESKKGELKEADTDVINLEVINFGPKDLKDQMILFDRHCDQLMSLNPVNVQAYDCFVSLIPLDFTNGSSFSRLFFNNLKIFCQADIETKLSKFIYLKFGMVHKFMLAHTLLFWTYNILLYYFMGFHPGNQNLARLLYFIGTLFNLLEIKFILTEGTLYIKRKGQMIGFAMHLYLLLCTIVVHRYYNREGARVVHFMRMTSVVFVSLRGIWLMRIFKSTRFLICMIYEVIKRIVGFFVMMFYTIFIFEAIWRSLPSVASGTYEDDNTFSNSLVATFSIAFMSYDTTGYELKEWIVFVLAILVLNFLMLNYLVSIICINYEEVSESKLMTDLDEVIKMINEADHLLSGLPHIWLRRRLHRLWLRIRYCQKPKTRDFKLKKEEESSIANKREGLHYITLVSQQEAGVSTATSPVAVDSGSTVGVGEKSMAPASSPGRDQLLDRITDITDVRVREQTQELIKYTENQNKKLRLEMDAKLTIFMQHLGDKLDSFMEEMKDSHPYRDNLNTSRSELPKFRTTVADRLNTSRSDDQNLMTEHS